MKRIDNLYQSICSIDNLILADKKARKGKGNQFSVISHDKNREKNIFDLHNILINNKYKTSEYKVFTIFEPKERIISKLPYYPDRIVHHAIMNVLEPIFKSMFIRNTYSCIKGRGIHLAVNDIKKALIDIDNTKYCLKLDITKFYPSVNHEILKSLLLRKFKDGDLLNILFEIIDSSGGIPIGNYLSQYFGNFYLCWLDRWLKEMMKVKYYFRYADDMVFLYKNKEFLHYLLFEIKNYLSTNLDLKVKDNYQIFPVSDRGLDFLGYKFYHKYALVRKSIKRRFAKMLIENKNESSINSYKGWIKHCDGKNLIKSFLNE